MNIKKVLLIAILFCLSLNMYAASSLVSFKIDGLKRTKEAYVQKVLAKYKGSSIDQEGLSHSIETTLQAEGVFSDIQISFEEVESGACAHISLTEKVALIPLPFMAVSNNSFMGGGFLLDMNALGMKNMFAVGGLISASSQMALLAFSKPSLPGELGFSTSASFSNSSENTVTNIENDTVFDYKSLSASASATLNASFGEGLKGSAGLSYAYKNLDDDYDTLSSYHEASLRLGLSYAKSDWNGYFMSGHALSSSVTATYTTQGELSEKAEFSALLQYPLVPRFRLLLQTSGAVGHNLDITQEFSKGSAGSFVLNSSFRTDTIAGAWAGFEWGALQTKLGLFSVYGQYEGVVAADYDDSMVFAHGPSLGAKLYLAKVAFPAFGMAVGYDIPHQYFAFSVSLGMSF